MKAYCNIMGSNLMASVLKKREYTTDFHREACYGTIEAEIRVMQLHITECQVFAQPLETGRDREGSV